MSHEIYYTSAPEGLKRGSSGFSTVGASDNIPRALRDRLETLSAYRHHFPAAANGRNPVSHAHWLLNVAGTTYHILSRICDSGADHTQRSNAFAHHVVVDNGEMAVAGPAWMLQRPGVMKDAWDSRVGAIGARSLPQGERAPAICRAWAAATGDAGWGGYLADVFIKTPGKPVCILFGPGQEMLPLIAETIALLPPMVRWNATFNTYFTSMPTSATCVWRCCLADTPAAQVGLRYAAGGVVIDLTDPSRLGQIPAGPYVTMARTGEPPATVTRAVAATPAMAAPARAPAARATPPLRPPVQSPPTPPPPPTPQIAPEPAALPSDILSGVQQELSQIPFAPELPKRRSSQRPLVNMRSADRAIQSAETQAANAAGRRRRQFLILLFSAMAAIALGMTLILRTKTSPPDEPTPPPRKNTIQTPSPQTPAVVNPEPEPTPIITPTAPAPTPPQPVKNPVTPPPIAPTPPVTPERQYPTLITCTTAIAAPSAGGGIGESSQILAFPKGQLKDPEHFNGPRLQFPGGKGTLALAGGGELLTSTATRNGKQSSVIFCKSAAGGQERELLHMSLDPQRSTIDLHWKTSFLIRDPEAAAVAFWALQSARLEINDGGISQKFAFKPFEPAAVGLSEANASFDLPLPLPKEAVAAVPANLPPGWKGQWYTDWEAKDAALRKPENASQVIKLEKPTSSSTVQAWFLLTFRPGFGKVDNSWTKRSAADAAALADAQSELRAVNKDLQGFAILGVKPDDTSLQPYLQKKAEISGRVDAYKEALAGYKELTELDVPVEMPDGTHLTTLHFHQVEK